MANPIEGEERVWKKRSERIDEIKSRNIRGELDLLDASNRINNKTISLIERMSETNGKPTSVADTMLIVELRLWIKKLDELVVMLDSSEKE